MQDTGTEHRKENAGKNRTKIRFILSRKDKTEDYYSLLMPKTGSLVPVTKGEVHLIGYGTRHMIPDADF
jgi:hypothetical protein